MFTTINPDRVLYDVRVLYSTPGMNPIHVDNVMTFQYDENPDRLVVHHSGDERTDIIITADVRLVHITVQ